MTATTSSRIDNIRNSLVGLRMPRALDILGATLRRIEQGQIEAIEAVEAIDDLLAEELCLRENRRVKAALRMARLPIIKTITGFDFSFQPSLDRGADHGARWARLHQSRRSGSPSGAAGDRKQPPRTGARGRGSLGG